MTPVGWTQVGLTMANEHSGMNTTDSCPVCNELQLAQVMSDFATNYSLAISQNQYKLVCEWKGLLVWLLGNMFMEDISGWY